MKEFKRLLIITKKYNKLLAVNILIILLAVILQLYLPTLFGDAIDNIIDVNNVNFNLVYDYLLKGLLIIIIVSILVFISNLINNRVAYKTIEELRNEAFKKIQKVPVKYIDHHLSGDIVQRIIGDVEQISDGIINTFSQFIQGVLTIIITLYFMFNKDLFITFVIIVMTPLSFIIARFIAKKSYTLFSKQTTLRGNQTSYINEMVSNAKTVISFDYQDKVIDDFKKENEILQDVTTKAVFYSSLTNPSTRAVNNTIYALVALLGSFKILTGSLTIGGLTVLLFYANQYMKPFNDISAVITELQNALVCLKRVIEIIDEKDEIDSNDIIKKDIKGEIEFKDVYFSYQKDKPLIEDFNIKINKGDKVAIVGKTGSGKTTLINLLMRFYDIDQGKIYLDGIDVAAVTRKSLRNNFGMVLQETWIKNATVKENITLGKHASDQEIIKVLKESHSYDFVKKLPDDINTIIDKDSISQGQKQLLCIARVMFNNPKILILDEATSNIDTRTELLVQDGFDKLMKNKTSVIVAHRLSTIRNANMIIVMDDGHVVEKGNHNQLLEQKGYYYNLYNAQFVSTNYN